MNNKYSITIIASLLLITTGLLLNAQGIIVHKTDGTKIEIPYNEFDSITTHEATTPPEVPGGTLPLVGSVAEAVDLGLPSGLKWASWNIGATKPAGYGCYYAWGETTTKATYKETNYTHYDSTKQEYLNIGDNISGTQYDIAHMMWGDGWRMPTAAEFQELLDYCSWTAHSSWDENGPATIFIIKGPNGNSIQLPEPGSYNGDSELNYTARIGYYWSSNSANSSAYAYAFASHGYKPSKIYDYYLRFRGCSIRAVKD